MSSAVQAHDDNLWEIPVRIVYSSVPLLDFTTNNLITLYIRLGRLLANHPDQIPGMTIIDCTTLISEQSKVPALYSMWVTQVSTPGVFSHSCAGAHLRRQFDVNAKLLMTCFNDDGGHNPGYGDSADKAAPGTYMIVLKRVDIEKLHCVPVSFTALERKAIKEYVADRTGKV